MDCCGWAKEPEEWTEEIYAIIQRFLIKSIAIDTSNMTENYVALLGITRSATAQALLDRIGKLGIEVEFKDKAEEVESSLSGKESNWKLIPAGRYVCTRSSSRKLHGVVGTEEYDAVGGTILEKDARTNIKRRFLEVDAVFRHLRNALAHGCFRIIDGPCILFFDKNSHGKVSAYACLSFEALNRLYQLLCDVAQRKI